MTDRIKMDVPFFQTPNAIFEVGLDTYSLVVYLYLARCCNQGAKAFPSYANIAQKCGISKRKAIEAVEWLQRIKLLAKRGRKNKKANANYSNVYVVATNFEIDKQAALIEKMQQEDAHFERIGRRYIEIARKEAGLPGARIDKKAAIRKGREIKDRPEAALIVSLFERHVDGAVSSEARRDAIDMAAEGIGEGKDDMATNKKVYQPC